MMKITLNKKKKVADSPHVTFIMVLYSLHNCFLPVSATKELQLLYVKCYLLKQEPNMASTGGRELGGVGLGVNIPNFQRQSPSFAPSLW